MADIPFTTSTSNLTPAGCRFTITGSFTSGQLVSISWTGDLVTSPCGGFGYAVQLVDSAGGFAQYTFAHGSGAHTQTWTLTRNTSTLYVVAFTDSYCSGGTLQGVSATGGYCQYGSTNNPSAETVATIGQDIIEIVVSVALIGTDQEGWIPWVITALSALVGTTFTAINCSTLPSPAPVLNLSDPSALQPNALETWFRAAAWNFFCMCNSAPGGSPAPVLPTPPTVTIPPGVPTGPTTITCSNDDICTTLNSITSLLQQILAQVMYGRRDNQIFQRQTTPFAYVDGTLHTSLTGAGTLAVADILGFSVNFTTIPTLVSSDMMTPRDYFVLGHITLGTADGWERNIRLTHNPHLVLPIGGEVTQLAYNLQPGVVANLQQLVAEPIG